MLTGFKSAHRLYQSSHLTLRETANIIKWFPKNVRLLPFKVVSVAWPQYHHHLVHSPADRTQGYRAAWDRLLGFQSCEMGPQCIIHRPGLKHHQMKRVNYFSGSRPVWWLSMPVVFFTVIREESVLGPANTFRFLSVSSDSVPPSQPLQTHC